MWKRKDFRASASTEKGPLPLPHPWLQRIEIQLILNHVKKLLQGDQASSNFTPQVKEAMNQSQIFNRKSISRNTTHRQSYHLIQIRDLTFRVHPCIVNLVLLLFQAFKRDAFS